MIEAGTVIMEFLTLFLHVDSLMLNDKAVPSQEKKIKLSFHFMQSFIFTKSRDFIFVRLWIVPQISERGWNRPKKSQNHGIITVGKVSPAPPP